MVKRSSLAPGLYEIICSTCDFRVMTPAGRTRVVIETGKTVTVPVPLNPMSVEPSTQKQWRELLDSWPRINELAAVCLDCGDVVFIPEGADGPAANCPRCDGSRFFALE